VTNAKRNSRKVPGEPTARPPRSVSVVSLVESAASGDQQAWESLVNRFVPLVRHVTHRYRLSHNDFHDVNQIVWLRLLENIERIREPRALPGWIVATTRNEALRVLKGHRRLQLVAAIDDFATERTSPQEAPAEELLRQERHRAVRDGLAELKPEQRELLLLLHAEPPLSYQEISRRLGIPTGSIGPTRARCLAKLRQTSALRLLAAS
jgi:RNA polymerase sigma factor (sigma-70 family)